MDSSKIIINVSASGYPDAILHSYLLDNLQNAPGRKRPAVIICAGGAYSRRSDRESEPIAIRMLAMGVHAFVLDYSVAPTRFPGSLLQLAKAVAYIRQHHQQWMIDPDQILVMGFSAGGHLACSLGAFWNHSFVYGAIGESAAKVKPNGMILCYPVITSQAGLAHLKSIDNLLGKEASGQEKCQISLEQWVSSDTPKTFLWHTDTDQSVPVEHSLLLASALKRHRVSLELHIFPQGKHGLALATHETAGGDMSLVEQGCQSWICLLEVWIKSFAH